MIEYGYIMKRITIITTGGTIGSELSRGALRPTADISGLLTTATGQGAPDAEYRFIPLMNMLSENMTGGGTVRIVRAAMDALEKSDGVILTHGTDTLEYTAAALSYAFGLSCPPVVLASAVLPPSHPHSDAPECLAACAAVAASDMRGVFACFASGERVTVSRASRLLPYLPYSGERFTLGAPFAYVTGNAVLPCPDYSERPDELPPADISALALPSDVLPVLPVPSCALPSPDGKRAVAFISFHSGTLPTARADFADYCRHCLERGVKLYAVCSSPSVLYESAEALSGLGITVLPRMTPASALTRLRLGLDLRLSLGGDILCD